MNFSLLYHAFSWILPHSWLLLYHVNKKLPFSFPKIKPSFVLSILFLPASSKVLLHLIITPTCNCCYCCYYVHCSSNSLISRKLPKLSVSWKHLKKKNIRDIEYQCRSLTITHEGSRKKLIKGRKLRNAKQKKFLRSEGDESSDEKNSPKKTIMSKDPCRHNCKAFQNIKDGRRFRRNRKISHLQRRASQTYIFLISHTGR